MVARRAALPPERYRALCAALGEHLAALPHEALAVVAFCWPIRNEPDLAPTLARWRQRGSVTALPVVVAADAPLAFRRWQPGEALAEDRYGIPTPLAGPFLVPSAILLPLNAFDAAGFRLGYGGGYFDRSLAALAPRPLAVGVGFEINRVASIHPQPHDQRLDWIVTEAGAWKIDAG